MDGNSISMVMIFHRIIHLQATIEENEKVRKIKLRENEKDPAMMKKLSSALKRLNSLNIKGPQGKYMIFQLVQSGLNAK